MPDRPNIYFFDAGAALLHAGTVAHTVPKNAFPPICFYDGEAVPGLPENCINVPIGNFYNFFLTTSHAFPDQINFDNRGFSPEEKAQITQSIIETLTAIKEQKTQVVSALLEAPLEPEKLNITVFALLGYLTSTGSVNEAMPDAIVQKLLMVANASCSMPGSTLFTPDTKALIQQTATLLESRFGEKLFANMRLLHLWYALSLLETPDAAEALQADYFRALAHTVTDLAHMQDAFPLVKAAFPQERLTHYLTAFGSVLFTDAFWELPTLQQKHAVYKFYFLTNVFYHRGEPFRTMYGLLHPVYMQALKRGLDELAFYLYSPLLISWSGVSKTQEEFRRFNDEVEKPLEEFIGTQMIPDYSIEPNPRTIDDNAPITVAFLQEYIIPYSVYKVFYSLIKALAEKADKRYRFVIYDLNFPEYGGSNPETVNELKQLGIPYIDLHKELVGDNFAFYPIVDKSLKLRERLIKDKVDILIGMNSRPEYNFLFTTRTAPKQLFWSHGNHAYELKTIDKNIIHFAPHYDEVTLYEKQYCTFPIELQHTKVQTLSTQQTQELAELENRFASKTVLATIGRLSKLENDRFLEIAANALQKHPNAVYLICGSGEQDYIMNYFKEKGVIDQVFFEGHIDAHVYTSFIHIFLNTFPYRQGASLHEARLKKVPCITYLTDELLKNMEMAPDTLNTQLHDMLHSDGIDYSCNVRDEAEYAALLQRLIEETGFREKAGDASYALEAFMTPDAHDVREGFKRCMDA